MANQPVYRSLDGALPQNIEAEQSVLGSLLIDPRAIERVASFLTADDFFLPVNAEIYRSMLRLFELDRPTDIITLADHLQAQNRLDDTGGAAYLASLATIVPTSINVEYYARIVERLGVLRRLVDAGSRISSIGFDERLEADDALEAAEKILFDISHARLTRDFEPLSRILTAVYEKLDHIHSHDSEVTGVTTGFVDLDRLTSGMQRSDLIILAGRPSMGKCLTAGTLIDDPDTGRRVTIEECVRQRMPRVFGLSGEGKVRPTQVGDWIDSGVQPCFRVTTRTGRSVEVTGHHPFLTVRGWIPLNELQVGDKIALPRSVPAFGTDTSMPRDLVRLLAYFVAEGGLTDTCPEFTNTDPEIVGDFKEIVERQFPTCSIRQDRITYIVSRRDRRVWTRSPNPVTQWLRELGLWGSPATAKRLPDCVWRWPRSYLAEFVRVLFSCDATIYAMQGYPRIEFAVASERLALDAHHALVRMGIVAKLWRKGPRCWRVEITEPESVARYQAEIGWIGEKAARFTGAGSARRSNVGHVPREAWDLVRAGAAARGMTLLQLGREIGDSIPRSGGYNPHTRRGISRKRLTAYAHVLSSDDLVRLASSDIYWDEIVSIVAIGDVQVYDLTVPDGANFIAQDVCVHNTALALNIAHSVAVKGHLPVGIFSIEMSAEQVAQRLLAIQAQVESQRLRNGRMSDSDWDRLVQAIGMLSETPIFVDDTPGLSTLEMRTKARRLHSEQGLGLLVVDYLQLMQGGASSENRVQEISAISRGLKALARELDIPILALSQLSRAPDQRPNHEPMLSDLRESGCLTGDTPVYLPDLGVYRRMDEMEGMVGTRVLALDSRSWTLSPRPVLRAFKTGRKPVFKLTTATGRTVRATGNHRFLTVEGWKRLDEICLDDRIAVPRQLPDVDGTSGRSREPLSNGRRGRAAVPARLHGLSGSSAREPEGGTPHASLGVPYVAPRNRWKAVQRMPPLITYERDVRVGTNLRVRPPSPHGAGGNGGRTETELCPYRTASNVVSSRAVRHMRAAVEIRFRGSTLREPNLSVARAVGSTELERLAESDVYWDKIRSIVPDGEEDVYDLTVEELHNFVAGDIVVHNSIEQDSDLVMFIYRDVRYNPETERPHVADVIVAKHRNGPTGTIHLFYQDALMKFLDLSVRDDG